jgi:hypothetical protein
MRRDDTRLFAALLTGLAAALTATSASAAVWEWACQGELGGQGILFDREGLYIANGKAPAAKPGQFSRQSVAEAIAAVKKDAGFVRMTRMADLQVRSRSRWPTAASRRRKPPSPSVRRHRSRKGTRWFADATRTRISIGKSIVSNATASRRATSRCNAWSISFRRAAGGRAATEYGLCARRASVQDRTTFYHPLPEDVFASRGELP